MPRVVNEGADLYWHAHGKGPAVLLIMGLSFTHEMWFRILPWLVDRYRVVLFDNRGMGRSSVPSGPYSIRKMARDAVAVLRAADIPAAHVVGASMGGMIAQELALAQPAMVQSLTLACTSHSGLFGRWPDFSRVPLRPGKTREARERAVIELLYADSTPLDLIEEDIRIRSGCGWTSKGFFNQFAGILMWSAYRRLPSIRVPTLVVHGDQDRLVPPENGRAVARRIPGAEFDLIPNAGHVMTTDQPELCSDRLLRFLAAQAGCATPVSALSVSAATPGSVEPPRNSREAPPPVDT